MATTTPDTDRREFCDDCDCDTPHSVAIELRAEREGDDDSAAFSREPYRVATCNVCEATTALRMNDA